MARNERITRRGFVKKLAATGAGAAALSLVGGAPGARADTVDGPSIYVIRNIPVPDPDAVTHRGVDALLWLLAFDGRKFYRSRIVTPLSGPDGIIASDDIVLVKVNAVWKYRGCSNSDIVKGVIQRVLDHPEGFTGEIVVFENGQGKGSLDCAAVQGVYPDGTIHANAEDESHSYSYLVNTVFAGYPVSEYLLDPIRLTFIGGSDHTTDGYRSIGNVTYPCFTTEYGHRVELREGLWTGSGYADKLKLINIPVLKHHDGCGMTGAQKNSYGILSMDDGRRAQRHYAEIGNECADMWCNVKTPALTFLDCIWVSPGHLSGYPESNVVRTDMLLSGFDPVALDYWASKNVLYPAGGNNYHDPDQSSELAAFLIQARERMNSLYGGVEGRPATMDPAGMNLFEVTLGTSVADLDGSGGVDAVDIQLAINEALGFRTGYNPDIDDDLAVTAVDIQIVINAFLGLWP